MAVLVRGVEAAAFDLDQRNAERSIDIAIAAAIDRRHRHGRPGAYQASGRNLIRSARDGAAPLSFARSEGRGSKASGSAAGGIMVSTCARSPTTARARLARSLVVASHRSCCAARPNEPDRRGNNRRTRKERATRSRASSSFHPLQVITAWQRTRSLAAGNARSCHYRASAPRSGNPSRCWRARRHRAA